MSNTDGKIRLAMQKEVENLAAVVEELQTKITQFTNANWDQNDETAADYIKNRPFYENNNVQVLVDSQISASYDEMYYDFGNDEELIAGYTYKITLNNDKYELTAFEYSGVILIGNPYLYANSSNVEDNGIPFALYYYPNSGSLEMHVDGTVIGGAIYVEGIGDVVFITVEYYNNSIKMLDEKFIPDTIARMSDIEDALDGVSVSLESMGVTVTADELNYVDGVTSNIQAQLDDKANISTLGDQVVFTLNGSTLTITSK